MRQMFRSTLALLFVSLAATLVQAQATQSPTATPAEDGDEVERVNVHLVSLPVSVVDRDGRFVADLREQDFSVAEDGIAQRISYFASTEQPFSVLLLIDTSGSTQLRLKEIQDAAIAFVNRLRPQDKVLPVAFDNDAVALLTEWTGDRERLIAAIRQARTGMMVGPNDTEVRTDKSGKKITIKHVNTRLYDAVHNAAVELRNIKGRKALILFTDGFDNASAIATRKSTLAEVEELDALIYVVQYERYGNYSPRQASDRQTASPPSGTTSQRAATVIIGPGGTVQRESAAPRSTGVLSAPIASPPVRPFGLRNPTVLEVEKYLESLSEKTGGRFYRADNLEKIEQSFESIAEELRRMYSIGYHPTPLARPGERREVKVRVGRERVSVRARKAYVFKPRN